MKCQLKSVNLLTFLCTFVVGVYSDGCSFAKTKNVSATQNFALQKLQPLIGKRFSDTQPSGDGDDKTYEYHVGICTDAIEQVDAGYGAVQVDKTNKDTPHNNIGKYASAAIMGGSNWVYLEYRDGETYGNHCGGQNKKSVILFTCDPKVTDMNDVQLRMIEEEKGETTSGGCYYLFEISHSAICDIQSSSSSLSVGSIILIVFVCVVGVYLLAGVLYQRIVMGAKGMEQIPNYEFWKDFGNLQADGCEFLCRSTDGRRNSSPYKGVGDELIEDAEERDDNLLPM